MNAELEKLVEQITDQIIARLSASRGHDSNGVDCAECSPHTLACALNAGASRIGLAWGQREAASASVARYIDHTLLKPEATRADVVKQRRARLHAREREGRAGEQGTYRYRGERALSTSWQVHELSSW